MTCLAIEFLYHEKDYLVASNYVNHICCCYLSCQRSLDITIYISLKKMGYTEWTRNRVSSKHDEGL